jgi:hypothetical protein
MDLPGFCAVLIGIGESGIIINICLMSVQNCTFRLNRRVLGPPNIVYCCTLMYIFVSDQTKRNVFKLSDICLHYAGGQNKSKC